MCRQSTAIFTLIFFQAELHSSFLSGGGSPSNGYTVVAHTLARLGVRHMFGVIGIPVTELASAAQVGILACFDTSCPIDTLLLCRKS